tara:strand:+ start:401 stop:805 length:405 start_codon:yes stop_codon:yes gene_type:complete
MEITKAKLIQIIKEEIAAVSKSQWTPLELEAAVRSGEIKTWINGIRNVTQDAFGGNIEKSEAQSAARRLSVWNNLAWCVRRNGYRRLRRRYGSDYVNIPGDLVRQGGLGTEDNWQEWQAWMLANKRGAWARRKR